MIVAGLILIFILAVINAAPLAFFTMLFLGNVGVNLSFWSILPAALAAKILSHNIIQLPTKTDAK